jgi:hypothetical protein
LLTIVTETTGSHRHALVKSLAETMTGQEPSAATQRRSDAATQRRSDDLLVKITGNGFCADPLSEGALGCA